MLDVSKLLDKPIIAGDYAAQEPLLRDMREKVSKLKPSNLASFEFDPRTRLMTVLYRVGRQTPLVMPPELAVEPSAAPAPEAAPPAEAPVPAEAAPPAEGEAPAAEAAAPAEAAPAAEPARVSAEDAAKAERAVARAEQVKRFDSQRRVFAELGALWKALGEEEHAAKAFALAGDAHKAIQLFEKSGTWEEAAALHAREGRGSQAARLYAEHEQYGKAAQVLDEVGDLAGAVRMHLKDKQPANAREVLKKMTTEAGKKLLAAEGAGDLLLDFLAARGRWEDIGKLYQKSGMHADAAQAFLKGGRTHMATAALRSAGDEAGAMKIIEQEAQAARDKGDLRGAAEAYARWKMFARAAMEIAPVDAAKAQGWVSKAGDDASALDLAKREAARFREAGQLAEAGRWYERAGTFEEAARAFLEGREVGEALRLFEQLGDWQSAGACAEQLGQLERAAEFYNRAGDRVSVERVRSVSPPVPAAPAAPEAAPKAE